MTVGATNNYKYPYLPATGASAVNIQIFEPKAFTNTTPATVENKENTPSAYDMPKGNLYGPTQTPQNNIEPQATTAPAQFQLTPEVLQATINTAVQLATAKAVEELEAI